LERHRPIELLPDQQWETLRDWLHAHPYVEIISRDRADCYAREVASGALQAKQVVDRFHLLQKLREAVKRTGDATIHEVQVAAKEVAFALVPCLSDRNTVPGVLASYGTDCGAGANRHVSHFTMKKRPSSRQVTRPLVVPAGELDADERRLLDAIDRHARLLAIAGELAPMNSTSSSGADRASVCRNGSHAVAAIGIRWTFVARWSRESTYR
jgi:hypothetical protein